jgi:glycosyltransferase involved in cell wall biosynthesis
MQRRDVGLARAIISPSERYRELLCGDYSVPRERVHVVPNPLDLQRFNADGRTRRSGPLTLLFVSRIAVRKGVEMIVELSHRLTDLAGDVRIDVVGPQDTWSDYRHLLVDLDPRIASYLGPLPVTEVAERYRAIDLVLVPSQYDPCPSVVREALACGVPVVASSEVGSAEGIDPKVCTVFPAGDADAFEAATRSLIGRLREGEGPALAAVARAEVEPRFGGATVAAQVLGVLERAVGSP